MGLSYLHAQTAAAARKLHPMFLPAGQTVRGQGQNRTEQNRTEQNRTEQNRTEQNRTEQNRTTCTYPPRHQYPHETDKERFLHVPCRVGNLSILHMLLRSPFSISDMRKCVELHRGMSIKMRSTPNPFQRKGQQNTIAPPIQNAARRCWIGPSKQRKDRKARPIPLPAALFRSKWTGPCPYAPPETDAISLITLGTFTQPMS